MAKDNKVWKPKVKVWEGTSFHSSQDTIVSGQIVDALRLLGFDAEAKGQWSFEDLKNGKLAFVTHHRRVASVNPYTVSQREAEKFIIQMFKGALPSNISMTVLAHGHTTRGSIDEDPFRVLNLPCWTSFIEYQNALKNFPHFQPDIGAYIIIVTKDGRIHTQKWLYKPFVYNITEKKLYEQQEPTKKYVSNEKVNVEPYFLELIKNARLVIVCVADFHCGEVASIAPPKYFYAGQEYDLTSQLTEANKRLYQYWLHFVETCKIIKPHEIWIVGDCLAGTSVFEKNRRVLTLNIEEQKAMFIELFKLLKE